MYVKDAVLWRTRQCGTMVDVSQVMIAHTITCQIHSSRHTTPLCNELSCTCSCTEILTLLTMKLELLSPLLSDSPFLSSKVFCFFRFSNLTVEWTKWNHVCWGPRKLSIFNNFDLLGGQRGNDYIKQNFFRFEFGSVWRKHSRSFLVFPRPVNSFVSSIRNKQQQNLTFIE